MNEDTKANLLTPYFDYINKVDNPTEEELGEMFDSMYGKSIKELSVLHKIYVNKLESLNNNEQIGQNKKTQKEN
jgi:predicted GTPase